MSHLDYIIAQCLKSKLYLLYNISIIVNKNDQDMYNLEYSNSILESFLSNYILFFKTDIRIILLLTFRASIFYNNTRFCFLLLNTRVLKSEIMKYSYPSEELTILKISLQLKKNDLCLPFQFIRLQFSLFFCFVMIINKYQKKLMKNLEI